MADFEDMMTNEALMTEKFASQFDLVNYAIGVAQTMVKTGRPTRIQTEIQNPAFQTLQEIIQGKEQLPVEDGKHEDKESQEETPEGRVKEDETPSGKEEEATV